MKTLLIKILAYLGAVIFLMGALLSFSAHFESLSWTMRIIWTLGAGLIFYYLAFLSWILEPLFLISAILFFLGLEIIFSYLGFDSSRLFIQGIISGALFLNYGLMFILLRRNIFMSLMIIGGSYFLITLGNGWFSSFFNTYTQQIFPVYLMLILGFLYCLLGFVFYKTTCEILTPALYLFGGGLFLAAVSILEQCYDGHQLLWDFILLGSVFLGFIFSFLPRVKSKIVLTWSTIFLVINIYILTLTYLHNLAWSWILMGLGIVLILAGYFYWVLIKKMSSKI